MSHRNRAVLAVALLGAASSPASNDVFQAALDPNPSLRAYTAAAQLSITLHAALPLHKTLNGTMYYNRPTQRLVLNDATGALSKYKDMRMTLPSKEEVLNDYTLTSSNDDGSTSVFVFAPKTQNSRVQSVTASITDATRLIHEVRWAYTNGSFLVITPTFQRVGNYNLAPHEHIEARYPGYRVDATLNLSKYTFPT